MVSVARFLLGFFPGSSVCPTLRDNKARGRSPLCLSGEFLDDLAPPSHHSPFADPLDRMYRQSRRGYGSQEYHQESLWEQGDPPRTNRPPLFHPGVPFSGIIASGT